MHTLLKQLDYNHWANGKIVEFLKQLDEQLWDAEVKSSFPSVRKTLYHIWDAEVIWFQRLKGESLLTWPSSSFEGDSAEAMKLFLENSKAINDFVATQPQSLIESDFTFKNTKGVEFTQPVDGILFHVVNHGTFHRGQLVTLLRELGQKDFGSQDLITFLREKK